ncbi:MAG: DUF1249 domain-containing protein [Pseudomonadales bacterium]|nr:DUF1249 domain-containing protein [Pseudomonadales bacterium]
MLALPGTSPQIPQWGIEVSRRTRYKIDLKRFLAECEANYRRLAKLFPEMALADERRLGLDGAAAGEVVFQVCERGPYTTLLRVHQGESSTRSWLRAPVLLVRVYHDARLAEVTACEGERNLWPRQEYPNPRMLQRDEKAQWNRFLGEWLAACLANGFVVADPCPTY